MTEKLKHYSTIALKGLGMGAADVVPGVSGGTIAFITGIYDELLASIKNLPKAFAHLPANKFNLKIFMEEANLGFLLSLLAGIVLSFLSLAKIITSLLKNHPVPVWSFFFGLILASVWFVLKDIDKWKPSHFVSLVTGIAAGYLITVIGPSQTPDTMWFIFISGAAAICAMILPGISGSFILLLLGKYEYMLHAINNLDLIVICVFALGAASGLISFSHFLSWLLKKYRFVTIAFLGGMMFGSLNKIWPWKEAVESVLNSKGELIPVKENSVLPGTYVETTGADAMIPAALIMLVAGFSLIFIIDKIAGRMKTKS
jgi:putative membrane protein